MPLTPDPLLVLNLVCRGASLALLLLMAVQLLRSNAPAAEHRLSAAFAVGIACYTLLGVPGFSTWGRALTWPVVAVESANGFLFWLLARQMFDDSFALHPWHAGVWLLLSGLGLSSCPLVHPTQPAWTVLAHRFLALATGGFALAAFGQMLAQWSIDLIESRRRWRLLIVGVTVPVTLYNVFHNLMRGADTPLSALHGLGNAVWVLAGVSLIALHMLSLNTTHPMASDAEASTPPSGVLDSAQHPTPQNVPVVDPPWRDQPSIDRLHQLMAEAQVFREPSLTIGALADRMGLLEYQLRRLINQGLGYRNFNAFLNHYRIADARAALTDPARTDWTVLKVATAAGFQSLGPFNRAFKADTGLTPTAYRQQHPTHAA